MTDSSEDDADRRRDRDAADRRRDRPDERARRRERAPRPARTSDERRNGAARSGRATRERSPEWPFAPPAPERVERAGPEPQQEQQPRLGLRASPDVDVAERADEIHVWCDLPGCAEDTIDLSGDEWTLYVSAERDEEYWEESGIQRRERSRHAERSISLPARSDVDAAEATFEDGVLFVRTPKHESERTQTIAFQ